MRVKINLVQPSSRLERGVYLWAPIVIVLAALILVRLSYSAGQAFIAYHGVHRQTLRYQAEVREMQTKEIRAGAILRRPETRKLYGQINFLNELIAEKQVSLSSVTLKVLRLLPAQARITGLALVQSENGLMTDVSLEGPGQAVAGDFLNNIEDSPDFDDITVTGQSFIQTGPEKGLVTVTCSARYVGKGSLQTQAERAQQ